MAIELDSSNFASTITSSIPTLVDFWAPWCGPCKMMLPVVDELSKELAGQATVAKVNVDAQGNLAAQFEVSAIPCFIVFKDGKEITRMVGAQSKEALKKKTLA